jgi:hypothetical protein
MGQRGKGKGRGREGTMEKRYGQRCICRLGGGGLAR